MNFNFRALTDKEKLQEDSPDRGLLKIAVPHWATELRIYDSSLTQIYGLSKITSESIAQSDGTTATLYCSEVSLPVGMYQVEASLEGKTENIWVPVEAEHVTEIARDAWKTLEFTSSAPLQETANSDDVHIKAAEDWSRKDTSKKAGKGESSLFLFMHTSEPKRFRESFTEGLQMFNETGEFITDFSSGVEKDETRGWMAYHAKMKSGGYILRRGRPGVRLRYQVIYLCDNWQTQVFVTSGRYPSLKTLSYNMTRVENSRHSAFQTGDKTALAAEAIFNFLRYDSDSRSFFNNERIDILLDKKTENPWLGILAAYAITKLKEDVKPEEQGKYQEYFTLLDDKILPFLQREIPSHPDVRALMLKNEEAAEAFAFPPMLWRSLTKIYNHGNFFDDTVPEGSLTDCMRENIVANSPWVAWRRLDQMPVYNWSGKSNHLFAVDKVIEEPDIFPVLSSTVPKAPVYKLPDFEQTDSDGPQQIAGAACAPQTSQELVQEISVVQTAKEVVKDYVLTGKLEELPDNLPLDRSDAIEKLLKGLDPRVVSELSSLSLNQVRGAIEQLKSHAGSAQTAKEAAPGPEQKLNLTTQQMVAQVACAQFDRAAMTAASPVTGATFSPGIKDLVSDLRTEAQRIFLKADQIEGVQAGNVQEVVRRMNAVATELLKRADFVLITDPAGKIAYCNGAFIQLISSPDESSKILSPGDTAAWQEARARKGAEILAGVALGSNNVSSEELPEGFRDWKVQRAKMQAGDGPDADDLSLDILRLEAFDSFTDEQLRAINTVVSELTNFTSLLAYGSKENTAEYLTGVEETLGKLERAVADTGTAKEK